MTMPLHDDEAPRLAEIGRRIAEVSQTVNDFRNEIRANFTEMVRKDLYYAERDAMRERITSLETRAKTLQGLAYGSIFTVIASLFTMWITRGGQ